MKIEVYEEGAVIPAEPVRLRLMPLDSGRGVKVVAVDRHGEKLPNGHIVSITRGGLHRFYAVSDALIDAGLSTEGSGRISIAPGG